ncbi:hypothetical protein H7F37_03685 [Winogradskyella sp. PAMC22761]|nr:hypothetical protein H7F37_03685 [Winogradskyella sp. PAMC22761]
MKIKKPLNYLLRILVFVAVYFVISFFINEYKAHNLPYGKKANEIRISADIPTIKSMMYSSHVNNDLLGNQWINIRKEPKKGEVLHVYKTAIPKDDSGILYEETDRFRKMDENGIIYQLMLNSIVENERISEQYGILKKIEGPYEDGKKIRGIELNNLLLKWKIHELK